jgi:hypothetical protein
VRVAGAGVEPALSLPALKRKKGSRKTMSCLLLPIRAHGVMDLPLLFSGGAYSPWETPLSPLALA